MEYTKLDFSSWFGTVHPSDITIDNSINYGTIKFTARGAFASAHTKDEYTAQYINPAIKQPSAKRIREVVLDQAKSLVVGERNAQYGEPYDDFKKTADALNAYGFSGPGGRKIMPRDVPFFQILVKLSRISQTPTKMDSWIDTAGYAACGAEVAEVEAVTNDRR